MMTNTFDLLVLSSNPLKRFAAWCTLEMRIVRRLRIDMKRLGYTIDSKRLRVVLYAPGFEELLASSPDTKDELHDSLKALLLPSETNGVIALRRNLARSFSERLPGSTRASNFAALQAEARHAVVTAEIQEVGRSIDTMGDQTSFSYRLADMHPSRAAELEVINTEWPLAARVVGALATAGDRNALLGRWAAHWPTWCADAPPALYGVLAEMASDARGPDETRTAIALISKGLASGLEPKGYWIYQVAILRGIDTVEDGAEALSQVRGYPLTEASLHPDGFPAAINVLNDWVPNTRREDLHRRLLLIRLLEGVGRIDEAIALAKSTAADLDSTAAAIAGARTLMMRHRLSASHQSDLTEALGLAATARTNRRRWHLDSGDALAAEIEIRRALSDHQGAMDIVNGIGEVPATPEELRHPNVLIQTAIVHAEIGDVEIAKRLVQDIQGHSAHISALIAERESRPEEAARLWAKAIDESDDLGDQAHLALQLAFHGVRSPIVDSLIADNAKIAKELTLVADLFAEKPGALEEFRGFANADSRGTMLLYTYYRRNGNHDKAAATARAGAVRWNDPDLWLESGIHERRAGNLNDAIGDVESALAAAEPTWGNRATAFRHLIELHSSIDNWQEAKRAAGHLLAAEPESSVAAWAMIICQLYTNDMIGALKTWQAHGSPAPSNEQETEAWIALLGEYGEEVGTARDALKIATRFATSEPIRRKLVGALFLPARSKEKSDTSNTTESSADEGAAADHDHAASAELLETYLRDFPDGAIRRINIDEQDPLAAMQRLAGPIPGDAAVDKEIQKGILPIGLAAEIYQKTYLEALLSREFGPVYTGAADFKLEHAAIDAAYRLGVIADLSALVTVARLPQELTAQMLGYFANTRSLTEHQRDTMDANRLLRLDSGLSFRPQRGDEPGRFEERTPDQVTRTRLLASAVEQYFTRLVLDSHPEISAIDAFAGIGFNRPFLLALDQALASQLPLWVDDKSLADLIRSLGGLAFSTPALLDHMRANGDTSSAILDVAQAKLVAFGYTGMKFDAGVWQLAVSLGEDSSGLLAVIHYGGSDSTRDRLKFGIEQIDARADNPEELPRFVHALASWVMSVAGDVESRSNNLRLLCANLLTRPWMTSSTLPYCIKALRHLDEPDAATALLREVYMWYMVVASRVNDEFAARVVFELVSHLEPVDAFRVRAAVLARSFD